MKKNIILLCVVIAASIYTFAASVPAKPTTTQIANDLVGTRLNEGYDDGWYSDKWHWDIEKGEIKALKIKETLKDTKTDYCIIVLMRLQSDVNAYNAKVKINYRLTKNNKWEIEYAISQGMDIVKTHKYDDCLSFAIVDDGWGGVNMLQIKNNSGIELGCAGYIKAGGEWRKFAVIVEPYQTGGVGGVFGGGNVTQYKIEFIERP